MERAPWASAVDERRAAGRYIDRPVTLGPSLSSLAIMKLDESAAPPRSVLDTALLRRQFLRLRFLRLRFLRLRFSRLSFLRLALVIPVPLGLFLLGSFFARPAAATASEDQWLRVVTQPFELYSNDTRERTADYARRLLELHEVLARLNPAQDIDAALPTRIFLVEDQETFVELGLSGASGGSGSGGGVSGYFFSTLYGQFLVINGDPRGAPLSTLFHEFLHHFVRAHLRFVPLWFNEGLAEYYSTFEVRDGLALVGVEKRRHLETLGLERLLSLERLHQTDPSSSLYNERRRRSIFYAQSWALVHLLLSDDHIAGTQEFLGRLSRGEAAPQALRSALGKSDLALEIELERYLAAGRFEPFTLALSSRRSSIPSPEALSRSEALAELGRLYVELERWDRAEAAFESALDVEPGSALALVGRARIEEAAGDEGSAIAWLEEAIAQGSESPEPDFHMGQLLLRRMLGTLDPKNGTDLDERSQAELQRARQHLRKSLTRDPDQPLARWRLGQSWLLAEAQAPGVSEGLESLGLAVSQLPWRTEIALDWIQLLARQRRFEQAEQALERLLTSRTGEAERAAGQRMIALERLSLAAWLVNHQQPDRGDALIDQVLDSAHPPGLRREIEPLALEIRSIIAHNRLVDLYNQALDELRQGQRERARSLLGVVAAEADDRRLRQLARQLLSEI